MESKLINNIYKKLEEINNDNTYFEDSNGRIGFLTSDKGNEKINSTLYKNIEVSDEEIIDEDGKSVKKVYINDEVAFNAILDYLSNDINSHFWEAVLMIEDAFSKKKGQIKKFRGDLSESIFLMLKGGEKFFEEESADITLHGNLIEIKSFSPTSREIVINNEQVNNVVQTFGVAIQFDNIDGLTILEISEKIQGNEKFKKYIREEYSDTFVGQYSKYSVSFKNVIEITETLKNLKLNSLVIEARVRLP